MSKEQNADLVQNQLEVAAQALNVAVMGIDPAMAHQELKRAFAVVAEYAGATDYIREAAVEVLPEPGIVVEKLADQAGRVVQCHGLLLDGE